MGNENVNSWLKDLYDTSYIVDSIANQLSKLRNSCNNAVTNETVRFIQEREVGKKLFFKKFLIQI